MTLPAKMTILKIQFLPRKPNGGDTVSTGIEKLRLHAEVPFARKTDGLNTDADDYAYAVAA